MAAHLLRKEAGFVRILLARCAVTNASRELPAICQLKISTSSKLFRVFNVRTFSTTKYVHQTDKSPKTGVDDGEEKSLQVEPAKALKEESEQPYRERYIPITRTSIVRRLLELDKLSDAEKKQFKSFSASLDSAIVTKYYHGLLQELKSLFDPINPDKDTIQTRSWNRQQRLDSEYYLIEKLEDVNERANFHELPPEILQKAMVEHDISLGVRVEVDPDHFDVLKIWALGKTVPAKKPTLFERMKGIIGLGSVTALDNYYKRVVVAIRLKKDQKLMLKAFKEVPVNSLEMLLPTTKIKMKKSDQMILAATALVSLSGLVAKAVTYRAHLMVNSPLFVAAVSAIIAFQAALRYSNKRSRYLGQLNYFLYNKNIANNRGLLALLVDRAEDESYKEALLTYTFLLTNREMPRRPAVERHSQVCELGGLTEEELENAVEQWLESVTGTQVNFHSSEATKILKDLGILSEVDGKFYVLPLEAAIRILPQRPHTSLMKLEESDLSEGYDGHLPDRPSKHQGYTQESSLSWLKFWK